MLRLYMPGPNPWPAAEFVARATRRLPPVLKCLEGHRVLIEIHNEPNHAAGIEGWGRTMEQAQSFAIWYSVVLDRLRQTGFADLGWPGLAVGEWGHGERTWAVVNRQNILKSDWVGCHCYWQGNGPDPEQMTMRALGQNWRWYR